MSDTRQASSQKAPRGPAKSSGCHVADANNGDSKSRLTQGAGFRYDLIQGKGNTETLALGDILVDVDTGPGGMGLVLWIVGG